MLILWMWGITMGRFVHGSVESTVDQELFVYTISITIDIIIPEPKVQKPTSRHNINYMLICLQVYTLQLQAGKNVCDYIYFSNKFNFSFQRLTGRTIWFSRVYSNQEVRRHIGILLHRCDTIIMCSFDELSTWLLSTLTKA